MIVPRHSLRRPLLHLVGANVDRLYKLPLKSSVTAIAFQPSLSCSDPCYIAAQRPGTGSPRLLVVNAKVRVVREEIELVSEGLDHRARQVTRIRQSKVMKRFVDDRERTVLSCQRREINFRTAYPRERYCTRRHTVNRSRASWSNDFGVDSQVIYALQRRR